MPEANSGRWCPAPISTSATQPAAGPAAQPCSSQRRPPARGASQRRAPHVEAEAAGPRFARGDSGLLRRVGVHWALDPLQAPPRCSHAPARACSAKVLGNPCEQPMLQRFESEHFPVGSDSIRTEGTPAAASSVQDGRSDPGSQSVSTNVSPRDANSLKTRRKGKEQMTTFLPHRHPRTGLRAPPAPGGGTISLADLPGDARDLFLPQGGNRCLHPRSA